MNDEIVILQNRFRDLADRAFSQNLYTFSGFLSLADQDTYHRIENELSYAHPTLEGGYPNAERVLIKFGSEDLLGYEQDAPIACIHVKPLSEKFGEKLGHRDILGALMNLGIERDTLGDIKISDKHAYIFCLDSISEYIMENLDQIRHTHVKCELVSALSEFPAEEPKQIVIQAASMRADLVISKVYNLSRNDSLELFQTSKVYINGRLCENNSKQLIAGDCVNARGFGKFNITAEPSTSKKGKLNIPIAVFA